MNWEPSTPEGREHGLSLLELTVAMGLTAALTASLLPMMHAAEDAFATASDTADLQQRLRVAVDVLSKDLLIAGAGAYAGSDAGPLVRFFAPLRAEGTGTTSDALTVIYVPSTAVQTTTAAVLTPASDRLEIAAGPGCPVGAALCGVRKGMTLLVYDAAGRADILEVLALAATYAQVRTTSRAEGSLRPLYGAGSKVVEAVARTYWRKTTPAGDQLMRDDAPVLDHVVGLTFEYFADPAPPALTPNGATYGPAPPPLPVQSTAYPAGENCTFQVDAATAAQVSRLPHLSGSGGLVKLTPAQLADGPWCPDDTDADAWDADLLRVRKVGITVRVEAAAASRRGPVGPMFVNGGTSRMGRWVPDQQIGWEIAPRNLGP